VKLFDTGWARGKITKFRKTKKWNCEMRWYDEPFVRRDHMLVADEYYTYEVDGVKPEIGAWFFLSPK
jgi:hypothetical protein